MLEELRFAIRIRGTSKRLRINSRCSRCSYHLPPQLPSASTCLPRMTEIKMVAASSISSCISAGLELGELPHKSNQNVDDGNDLVFCENVWLSMLLIILPKGITNTNIAWKSIVNTIIFVSIPLTNTCMHLYPGPHTYSLQNVST